jgi:hypothetical protein
MATKSLLMEPLIVHGSEWAWFSWLMTAWVVVCYCHAGQLYKLGMDAKTSVVRLPWGKFKPAK